MTRAFTAAFRRFLGDESGATLIEYGIIVAFIAAVCFAVVKIFGLTVQAQYTKINSDF